MHFVIVIMDCLGLAYIVFHKIAATLGLQTKPWPTVFRNVCVHLKLYLSGGTSLDQ